MNKISFLTNSLATICCLFISTFSYSAGFQIWEQDAATMGDYHAGYAVEAQNASIAFYNPAAMLQIPHQQISLGGIGVFSHLRYIGIVAVNSINNNEIMKVRTNGGGFAFIPNFHYVAPLSSEMAIGWSVSVPFGSKINYGRDTFLRYASTYNGITVIDTGPSLAWKIQDQWSLGAGFDIQRMEAQFDAVGVLGLPDPEDPDSKSTDTLSTNKLKSTAYGYHLGLVYELSSKTKIGLSYHSAVKHHLKGSSTFSGPLADPNFEGEGILRSQARSNITLPAYTAFSISHQFHPQWLLMSSAIYTQWNSIQNITLTGVSGLQNASPNPSIQINVPQYFRNNWNLSVGAHYLFNRDLMFRMGVGYDETPARPSYRSVQLPDNNRYITALGAHYQASKNLALDLSWMHVFMRSARINPPPLVIGDQIVVTTAEPDQVKGHVTGGANVFGLQLTWDMV